MVARMHKHEPYRTSSDRQPHSGRAQTSIPRCAIWRCGSAPRIPVLGGHLPVSLACTGFAGGMWCDPASTDNCYTRVMVFGVVGFP